MQTDYLIIGSSAAGMGAVTRLVQWAPESTITVVTAEKTLPYNTCFLVDWLAREKSYHELFLKPESFFTTHGNLTLLRGQRVVKLDPKHKTVLLADGTIISYKKLLLATGVRPKKLPGLSSHVRGIYGFHDLADTLAIDAYLQEKHCRQAVVIGAGLTGIEAADALWRRGLQVTLVDCAQQLLQQHTNRQAAQVIADRLAQCGVEWRPQTKVVSFEEKQGVVCGVELLSGEFIAADLVLYAIGVVPNQIAGMEQLEQQGDYLRVNQYLQTSDPAIWAAGDLVFVRNKATGLMQPSCTWPDATMQGMIAASNMVGREKYYPEPLIISNSHFFDLPFVSCGVQNCWTEGMRLVEKRENGSYTLKIFDEVGTLRGFLLLGNMQELAVLKRAMLTRYM